MSSETITAPRPRRGRRASIIRHAVLIGWAVIVMFPIFWIFGFWGVVGPAIGAWRVHKLMNALEHIKDRQQLIEAYERHEGKEIIVDLIASDTGLPKFIARRFYDRVVSQLIERQSGQQMESA